MTEEKFEEFCNKDISDSYNKFIYHLRKQIDPLNLRGKQILEVGCGKGFVSLWIALFGGVKEVVALD